MITTLVAMATIGQSAFFDHTPVQIPDPLEIRQQSRASFISRVKAAPFEKRQYRHRMLDSMADGYIELKGKTIDGNFFWRPDWQDESTMDTYQKMYGKLKPAKWTDYNNIDLGK